MSRVNKKYQDGIAICVCTKFWPDQGGIETLAESLAFEWVRMGHEVEIVTDVILGDRDEKKWPFQVQRNPTILQALRIARRSDIVLHMNISLKLLWPVFLSNARLVAGHQSWYRTTNGRNKFREWIKLVLSRRVVSGNISCSEAVRSSLKCGGVVIPNSYNHHIFHARSSARNRELIFVGRLVSDKGIDVLLEALSLLKQRGLFPTLTIVGEGPERNPMEKLCSALGLEEQTHFVGSKGQAELSQLLNEYDVMVVPSRWEEPFGIVALEGAASGCVVVGSSGGGLPEAIGPCGVTFANGDSAALADKLQMLLKDPEELSRYRAGAESHLKLHRADAVAEQYVDFFRKSMKSV